MTRIAHVARMGVAISMASASALFATDDRLAYAFVRDGLYYYDVGSYVQDGLLAHFDGIRNAGLGQPHSETTNVWANLADPGNPAPITQLEGSTNYWCGQGFFFGDAAYARIEKNIDIGFQCTLQAATDFVNLEQRRILNNENRWPTVIGTGADNCIFYTQKTNMTMTFRMNDITGKWSSFSWGGKYITALWDYDRQGASQNVVPALNTQGELLKPLGPQRWSAGRRSSRVRRTPPPRSSVSRRTSSSSTHPRGNAARCSSRTTARSSSTRAPAAAR